MALRESTKYAVPAIHEDGVYTPSGRQLAKNRLSDNVGGVKQLLSIPIRALGEERHFALVEMAVPTTGSLVIVFQVQTLGPTHASLRSLTAIMINTSNSSLKRSGTPNQLLG